MAKASCLPGLDWVGSLEDFLSLRLSLSLCLPLFISLSLTFLAPPEKRERERSMGCWWMMGGDHWPCRVSAALLPEEMPGPQGHSHVTLPLSWRMPLPPLRERAMSNVYQKKKVCRKRNAHAGEKLFLLPKAMISNVSDNSGIILFQAGKGWISTRALIFVIIQTQRSWIYNVV